jgi:Glycosyl hydrolase catalytic core
MVLGPEISSGDTRYYWITDLLQQAGNKIDIISFHQYDGGDTPAGRLEAIDTMHNFIVNLGYGNKPIWITESGWASDNIGEQTQADYLTGMLAGMSSRPWAKKFFSYQIWEGPTDRAGLLHQDETPKLAWYAYRDYTAAHPAPETVSVNLSTTDIVAGVNLVTVGDGNTTPDTKASRACRRNTNAAGGDYYMYFNVDDAFAFEGNRPAVAIDVDYYDLGTGTLTLQYDSIGDGAYKSAGSVTLGNKDTWKQYTFHLDDAYFGNRQNNGADFRLSAGVGTTFYLDLVQLSVTQIVPQPGDFNADGTVDAADYVVWRKTDGSQAGYNTWRAHFGEPGSSGSRANVPEPTLVMLIVTAAGVWTRRR